MTTCDNCGRTIGNLERPAQFDGHSVCAECFARLAPPPVQYARPIPRPRTSGLMLACRTILGIVLLISLALIPFAPGILGGLLVVGLLFGLTFVKRVV